jgi:hypothetical protein
MAWAKLGDMRVNTDAIDSYQWDHGDLIVLWRGNEDHEQYDDPDGALLRALDDACGLSPVDIDSILNYLPN